MVIGVPILKHFRVFTEYRLAHTYLMQTLQTFVLCGHMYNYVYVYSNSRNDVPRVAQRYGTIAAHTRHRASALVVYVVLCMLVYSFAGLIRRTPSPTFSDTAITDHHSDTTSFQLRAHWVRISWSIGSEKSFGHVPPVGVCTIPTRAYHQVCPLYVAPGYTVELQWLEHLWDHENQFEAGVVRATEG